ncbi:MAG: hypothetical protein U0231_21055, partial [Nitrospiraceae bacterium]
EISSPYGSNVTSLTSGSFSYGQGNGFTPNIAVGYATKDLTTNAVVSPTLLHWDVGNGDLVNVAFPSRLSGHYGEIALLPQAGTQVRLNSFDLSGFAGNVPGQTVRVMDGLGTLAEFTNFTVIGDGPGHSPFAFGPGLVSRSGALRVQFGFDKWDVAIDNVNFDQLAPVPLPPAVLLMGTGLAGLGAWLRRSPTKTA